MSKNIQFAHVQYTFLYRHAAYQVIWNMPAGSYGQWHVIIRGGGKPGPIRALKTSQLPNQETSSVILEETLNNNHLKIT